MKTLIFGAGPIGSVYAYLLHKAGKDVTILARNKHFDFIKENGVVLVNEWTGKKEIAMAMHARAAADEFKEHTDDIKTLAGKTSVKTPNIDKLRSYFS